VSHIEVAEIDKEETASLPATGQSVNIEFIVKAAGTFWAKSDDIYCPYCGEKGKTYISCGKKKGDAFFQILKNSVCVGCTYWGNIPEGHCINSPKTSAGPWFTEVIEELKDITDQQLTA
jgi:hypothetical protein